MNKRKMCQFYYGSTVEERECRKCSNNLPCPDNVNARCELVPRKAKPKMVRVQASVYPKAMMDLIDGSCRGIIIRKLHREDTDYVPCTILIEAKWLKGVKG